MITILAHHHYLGFERMAGENLRYVVRDRYERDLACLLFGAAAWKTKPRDQRSSAGPMLFAPRHLFLLANNTRFLILPWVKVPLLASHLLAAILRRISASGPLTLDKDFGYGYQYDLIMEDASVTVE